MKYVFQRFRRIRCDYESLRCLDLEIWGFLCWQTDRQMIALPLAAHACAGYLKLGHLEVICAFAMFSAHALCDGRVYRDDLYPIWSACLHWRYYANYLAVHQTTFFCLVCQLPWKRGVCYDNDPYQKLRPLQINYSFIFLGNNIWYLCVEICRIIGRGYLMPIASLGYQNS